MKQEKENIDKVLAEYRLELAKDSNNIRVLAQKVLEKLENESANSEEVAALQQLIKLMK